MLHDTVCNEVAWMYHVFVPGLECDLVYQAFSRECQQASSRGHRAAPVCQVLLQSAS